MTLFPFAAAGFVGVSVFHVAALAGGDEKAAHATKPLLMPLLFLAYLSGAPHAQPFTALALLAGFIGDVLLMDTHLFAAGLFAFLAGHLCYTAGFLMGMRYVPAGVVAVVSAGYLVLGAVAVRAMRGLPRPKFAICLCYLAAILLMSCSALLRAFSGEPFLFAAWVGSLCFIASDSLLGLQIFGPGRMFQNRAAKEKRTGPFRHPDGHAADALLMGLYIVGQTLLAVGCAF